MTDARLTPTHATEQLDHRGLLAASHGPGCYALRLSVPDSTDAARSAWDAHHDARPPEPALERLAAADGVAYVGAAGHVYDRIMDHAEGVKRQAAVCKVFPPTEVLEVWPHEDPFTHEWDRARRLSRERDYRVWCDGVVLG
jgi:hypothetical protein